jgi:hypothetical protein
MSLPLEYCFLCDQPTGRAGIGEDSLYDDFGHGPFCESCWDENEKLLAESEQP